MVPSHAADRRFQTRFGINQEHRGCDDLLAFGQTANDLEAIAKARAKGDGDRLKPPSRKGAESKVALARAQHGILRNEQSFTHLMLDPNIRIHAGFKPQPGIWDGHAHLGCSAHLLYPRLAERDTTVDPSLRIR